MGIPLQCMLLALGAASAAAAGWTVAPWPERADAHLRADTTLDFTRWRGARPEPLERTDVRQRLGMTAFIRHHGPRITFDVDLEIGSDFGPEPDAWLAQPDPRRAVLDLYAARLDVRFERLQLTLGRQILYDVLGVDALDGLEVRLRAAPFLRVSAAAGLASRRRWSAFGPDLFEPDGAGLADRPGLVLRGRVHTVNVPWVDAAVGSSRQADDQVQRERAAGSLRIGPTPIGVAGAADYDALSGQFADLELGLDGRLGPVAAVVGWQRHRPIFSGDSIWNAFAVEPWDAWRARAHWTGDRWALSADGQWRRYPSGATAARTPGLATPTDPEPVAAETAVDLGARVVRRLDGVLPGGHLGLEARLADGYGGARHYGDVFGRVPVVPTLGRLPVWLRARLGAVWFEVDPRADASLSGWALLAAEWAPEENMRLEVLGEVFGGRTAPDRMRVMARLRLEDWW